MEVLPGFTSMHTSACMYMFVHKIQTHTHTYISQQMKLPLSLGFFDITNNPVPAARG